MTHKKNRNIAKIQSQFFKNNEPKSIWYKLVQSPRVEKKIWHHKYSVPHNDIKLCNHDYNMAMWDMHFEELFDFQRKNIVGAGNLYKYTKQRSVGFF